MLAWINKFGGSYLRTAYFVTLVRAQVQHTALARNILFVVVKDTSCAVVCNTCHAPVPSPRKHMLDQA